MSPEQRRRVPLAYLAVERAGLRAGVRSITALICWGIVADELGREPLHQEVWEYWKSSSATHYRDMVAFRRAFPGEDTPQRLWLLVRRQITARDRVGATAQAFAAVVP